MTWAHGNNIECQFCYEIVAPSKWAEHARMHNPAAYRLGWPCKCRPGDPCPKHDEFGNLKKEDQ